MSDRLNPVRARTPNFALNTELGQGVCRVNKPFSDDGVYQPAQTTAVAPAPGMLDGLARLASERMARLESTVPPGYQTVFRAAAIGLGQNVYETDARLAILAGLETLYSSTDDPRYQAAQAQFAQTERSALLNELAAFLSSTAAQPVPNEPLERFFVGLSTGLDPHTRLQASNTMNRIRHGSGVSLGAATTRSRDGVFFTRVEPGGPAATAGLQPGDRIVEFDGRTFDHDAYTESMQRLFRFRDSDKSLTVERAGVVIDVTVPRKRLVREPIQTERIGDVGVITLSMFTVGMSERLEHALNTLEGVEPTGASDTNRANREDGPLEGLVFDLRGNPGGTEPSLSAELFLDRGVLSDTARVAHDVPCYQRFEAAHGPSHRWEEHPRIVILVDEGTFSAAEVFAQSLGVNDRAVVVGLSGGKATTQMPMPIDNTRELWTSISVMSVNGLTWHDRGVGAGIGIDGEPAQPPLERPFSAYAADLENAIRVAGDEDEYARLRSIQRDRLASMRE
ncbi:MAG: S41 family peptidase [Myxococcota bacterium]